MSRQREQFVELSESQEQVIETIMAETNCPKDFECYRSKFENLCPARHLPRTNLIECQSGPWHKCLMSVAYGDKMRVCGCRLRNYVAAELEIRHTF
jgi:hypothetical protein